MSPKIPHYSLCLYFYGIIRTDLMFLNFLLAQLDGVSEKAIKRLADHHSSINDWLELSEDSSSEALDKNGKRRVSFL